MKNPNEIPDNASAEMRHAEMFADQIATLEGRQRPTLEAVDATDQETLAMARRFVALSRSTTPDPSFVTELEQRLVAQFPGSMNSTVKPPARRISRRVIVGGGVTLAAGLTGGVLLDRVTHPSVPSPTPVSWSVPLVGGDGTWLVVAQVSMFPPGSVQRFTTSQIVGHLHRRTDGTFIAFSAACTHMGCLVTWNASHQTFDCPCHRGRFDAQGIALPGQRIAYRPLPTLMTNVEGDVVSVYVPTFSTPQISTDPSYPHDP